MTKFYTDEKKKIINSKLLDEEAEKIAKSFFDRRNKVSGSQLRKFFNEVKDLEKKIEVRGWDEIMPLVKMVKSKICYATSPTKIKPFERDVYNKFKDFIQEGINSIEDKRDFEAFSKYFEAVVGFYYGNGGK
jgi:CRISPR type III-A-associated protein Csm2